MYSMFVFGTILIIKGVFNFFPFEIKSNVNASEAYNSGHIVGYIIGKFGKIALGVLMLKLWLRNLFRKKDHKIIF